MNKRKILALLLTFNLATTTLVVNVSSYTVKAASEQITTSGSAVSGSSSRISGSDRYETAAQVAVENWTTPENVVLVSGEGYADAISASVLAKKLNAPILLTTSKILNSYTKTALDTLKPKNIYVVGGNASVSKEVKDSLRSSYNVVVLCGANRYETNTVVAKKLVELGVDPSNAILVGGEGFSDALTVASIAAAKGEILLLGSNDLEYIKPITSFINEHKSKVTVVGTNFVINDDTYKAVNGVNRISGGTDRFDTNLKVLAAFKNDIKTDKVYVANSSGDGYADALVASVLAGKNSAPLVLVDNETSKATDNAIDYLKTNLTASAEVKILGGTGVLPESIVTKIKDSISKANNQTNTATSSSTSVQTFTGYIIDEDCFAAMSDDPGSDTKTCLNMKSCAASGYGVAVSQGGSYKFYYFDGSFAPDADGGQLKAANLIKSTTKGNHVTVTVKGTLKGDTKTAESGKSYPVITVSSLSESTSGSSGSSSSTSSSSKDLNDGGTHSGDYSITTLGIFGSTDSSKPTTINGNVNIKYNAASTDSITLQNLNINGTLAVDFGSGNAILDNVTVNGVKVTNVGSNSLHAKGDTSIESLIVNDNDAHIIIEENAIITDTTVNGGAKLEVGSNATNAKPFENVIIASAAANSVVLKGGFNNIKVSSEGANLDLQESTVEILLVSSEAKAAIIKTADITTINNLNVNAPISITGNGSIINANLGVSGATIEKVPTNIAIVAGVTAIVAGNNIDESNATSKIDKVSIDFPTLSSISITTPATKLNYTVGDKLDITGLQVTGTYSDNTTAVVPINKANVTGFDSSKAVDEQVLTITVGGKTTTYTITVNAVSTEQTLYGILIDADCSGTSTPEKHTKACNLMPGCADSGYGIDVKQADGTYKFYKFDDNGQKLAKDILDKTTRTDGLTIVVKGVLEGSSIKTSSIVEDISVAVAKNYRGWLSDSNSAQNISDPTKITKTSLENGDYGILVVQTDYSFKFYKFDEDGQKLVKETIIDKTIKDKDLRIKINGVLDESTNTIKLATVQEEQELIGTILTKNTFDNSSDPTTVKRDEIVAADSVASGYGVAVKGNDGKYKFYKFDDAGQKSAKSVLSWYVNWAENVSNIPVLVQGVVDGDNIITSAVIRERYIAGQLASKAIFDQDKALKDITRADLLTPESVASGYGYYVHSCGGHQYFPFDKDSNDLIKKFIEDSKTEGEIKVIPKGFWYWIGNNIKITSISEDFNAETTPETPVNEELSGVVATRNYFKGSEYQKLGAPGTITKEFLQDQNNAASGYGIIYNTCCKFGYLRFDEKGIELIKDIINKSNNTSNIKVIVRGTRDGDTIYVTSIIEANEQTYSGTLVKTDADGYGVKVKQEDGTYKFYKFDVNGYYYKKSGQIQAENLLAKVKKDSTTVDVKGTLDGNTLIVSSITENLSITPAPSEQAEQTLTGYIEDVHCFLAKSDPTADSKGCLLMKSCAASGFGITVLQSDGSKKFYFFDGTFANNGNTFTEGTDGQLKAWNLVQNTTKSSNISITVKGTLNGTEKTYVDKNGASHSYQVLTVSSLSETSTLDSIAITTPATKLTYSVGDPLDITGLKVTGIYADTTTALQSVTVANISGFDSSKAADGQVLTITVGGKTATYTINVVAAAPTEQTLTGYIIDEDCLAYYPDASEDSKGCLSMKSCAASGYGIAVPQSDNTYKFYYFDGDFATLSGGNLAPGTGSQLAAYNLIQNTTKTDHISIKVTGILNGDTKTAADGKSYPVITVSSLAEN